MPNVLSTLPGQGTGAPQRLVVSGYVSQNQPAPAAFDDQLMVILPELSIDRPFGPCEWGALHGATLPVQGAPVTVVFDTNNVPVVVWWGAAWSREQPQLITSGSIAATITTPYDGQRADYLADQTKGIIWRFRYRAFQADGSTPNPSAYKWEYEGGGDLTNSLDTVQSFTADSTFHDATTAGPTLTLPLAGDWTIWGKAEMAASTAATILTMIQLGAIGPVVNSTDARRGGATIAASSFTGLQTAEIPFTSVAASTVAKLVYWASAGSPTAGNRKIFARPVRVA